MSLIKELVALKRTGSPRKRRGVKCVAKDSSLVEMFSSLRVDSEAAATACRASERDTECGPVGRVGVKCVAKDSLLALGVGLLLGPRGPSSWRRGRRSLFCRVGLGFFACRDVFLPSCGRQGGCCRVSSERDTVCRQPGAPLLCSLANERDIGFGYGSPRKRQGVKSF